MLYAVFDALFSPRHAPESQVAARGLPGRGARLARVPAMACPGARRPRRQLDEGLCAVARVDAAACELLELGPAKPGLAYEEYMPIYTQAAAPPARSA